MAWTLTSGSLSSSSSVTVSSVTFKASEFKRYSWRCPTTGTYQWLSTVSGGYCDVYGWVSTSSTAYDLSQTSHPIGGSYITSNDDSNGNGQFLCTFNATAGTTYYLYASPYSSSTDTSGKTFQLQLKIAVALWTVIGASLTNTSTASANRNYSTAGQIYRYAWTCPATGLYQWYSSSMDITCYLWVATISNAYNVYTANYPYSNAIILNASLTEGCVFQATANVTYYLYSSAWSNTATSQLIQTQTIRQVYWRLSEYGNFLSSGTTFSTTLTGQYIKKYTFIPPTSATYTFAASNCTKDSVGWISTSATAYNLTTTTNSRTMGTWNDDDSNGSSQFKVTAPLVGGTVYYLYFSPYSSSTLAYNTSVNITLTLGLSSTTSLTGTLITAKQLSAFQTLWRGLCTTRKYYGNLNNTAAKNAFSVPTTGAKATSTQMNSILNTFNKYFTPTITTVNTGALIQGTTYNTLVTNTMNSPSCKVACTGFCSSTNSGAAQPATCSSCDTGCSSSCYGTCKKTCYGNCSTGCYGHCSSDCNGNCYSGCTDSCDGYCNENCEGRGGSAPSKDCGRYCDSNCGTSCGGGCIYDCWSCEGDCTNSCDDSCNLGCTNDCTGDCQGGCDTSCNGYCDSTCKINCAGGTSGTAGTCNNSCTHSCATSCSTLCITSSS